MKIVTALRAHLQSLGGGLFAGRFGVAAIVLATFLVVGALTRIGLALLNGDLAPWAPWRVAGWLALGALFDLGVGSFLMIPFGLIAWLAPDTPRGRRVFVPLALLLVVVAFAAFVFVAAAEFVFWNEFGARFNFIAVDYLIYTNEVIGNLRESYPMPLLLGAVAAVALLLVAAVRRPLRRATTATGIRFAGRGTRAALLALVLPACAALGLDPRWKEFSDDAAAVQLAGNGWYEFVHAFRTNEIDYARYYRSLPGQEAAAVLRAEFGAGSPAAFAADGRMPIERDVLAGGPERRLNVVLISVESLSADFMAAFGNPRGLTPRLDALARDGLLFTRLYATGTRTVRGLEAITLSLPPTPGHSVVKRPDNGHLFSLGAVFSAHGYEPIYLYGGYSYFDNMREFFGANGYTVVDRGALAGDAIHAANIWGVADEDLFTLSLRELDRRTAAGRPFFAHVMTTSNHRPFTYPEGRIDMPSGSGRDGAVKYTDWAIGDFIDRARTRPWYDDTLFVIVADHCASSRGKTDLPIERFHIPMIVYAPRHVAPGRVDTLASQIDVAPTLLAMLNFSYRSRFFGQDILTDGRLHQRALLANYQTVGYLQDGLLVELRPKGEVRLVDAATGRPRPLDASSRPLLDEAVAYYQVASEAFRSGALRLAAGALRPGNARPAGAGGATPARPGAPGA
jgi:phosphoglycerol transferase MdoB-like AlkP superfamily enzyme